MNDGSDPGRGAGRRRWRAPLAGMLLLAVCCPLWPHGGVLLENDVCVINIGFFKSHFTIYQPHSRGEREFCEDLPDAGHTVFVLDYLHPALRELPVDFRIIHDVADWGRYARWQDVQGLGDLSPLTVLHQTAGPQRDGALTAEHDFVAGRYIGVVSVRHRGETYRAVFPFTVGRVGPGAWVLLVPLAAGFLLYVLASNRGWLRRRRKGEGGAVEAAAPRQSPR